MGSGSIPRMKALCPIPAELLKAEQRPASDKVSGSIVLFWSTFLATSVNLGPLHEPGYAFERVLYHFI
jgi:hypothetical protein